MDALVAVCVGNSVGLLLSARIARVQGYVSFLGVMAVSRKSYLGQRLEVSRGGTTCSRMFQDKGLWYGLRRGSRLRLSKSTSSKEFSE